MRGSLLIVEPASLAILGYFLYVMARGSLLAGSPDGRPRAMRPVLQDIVTLSAAAWVAEVSCIRLYGFYQYDAPWVLFLDVMPVLVALIWPFVLLSARELVHRARLGGVGAVFAMVLYDAALIEPVAVKAGLWSWNEPGLFGVPVIGILGWAIFGAFAVACLDRLPRRYLALTILIAPLGTHLVLLASWWGALRWILRAPIAPELAAAVALGLAVVLGLVVRRRGTRVGLEVMAPRICAAILFFVLLFLRGSELVPLMVYGCTFSIPYLLATRWRFERATAAVEA